MNSAATPTATSGIEARSRPKIRFQEMIWVYLILIAASDLRHWGVLIFAIGVGLAHLIWVYSRVWGPRALGNAPPEFKVTSLFIFGFVGVLALLLVDGVLLGVSTGTSGRIESILATGTGSSGHLWIGWLIPNAVFIVAVTLILTLTRWLMTNPANPNRLLRFIGNGIYLLLILHMVGNGVELHRLLQG